MSKRVESNIIPFEGKNYITVTTIEGNDGEPKKTEIYEKISEARYNEIAKKDGFDDLSISPTHGRRLLLLTSSGPIEKRGAGSKLTKYGDDGKFGFAIDKTGKNSLTANLNAASIESVRSETGKTREEIREYYPEYANTAIENIAGNIKFSSEGVPLVLETNRRRTKYDVLYYPENIRSSKQDKIVFGMRYISGKRDISFNVNNLNPLSVGNRNTETITGSVTLPIPGGISDKNSVKFEGETLDLGMALGAGAILNPTEAASAVTDLIKNAITMKPEELQKVLNSDTAGNIVSALRLGLAQSFTGGNLVSRLGGGVLNPNMELLFQAPTLRSFSFSFTMSARSRTEATQIKKIIRFFKQGMSVKRSTDKIFIVSPNTFKINYILGNTGNNHPSIGRIKECALTDLNTTYGNGSTYMTFDDPERTLTTYKIEMTFTELEPITEDDYGNSEDLEGAENFMLLPTIESELGTDSHIGY